MNIKVVSDVSQANAVTHGGPFHADDVLATAMLGRVFPSLTVARVSQAPTRINSSIIIYDIGCGRFDHHQKGGNGQRRNGVPYASAGLIWHEYGHKICQDTVNPHAVWLYVDKYLVQGVDANDNGVMPSLKYPCQPRAVPQIVEGFYPPWDAQTCPDDNGLTAMDYAFMRAVEFVDTILENTIKYGEARARAKLSVQASIQSSENGVMVLPKYMPWKEALFKEKTSKASNIKVVVYPDTRSGYSWCVVPNRAIAPQAWRGLTDKELQDVSGFKSAVFAHPAGFMGCARELTDALDMAKYVARMSATILALETA